MKILPQQSEHNGGMIRQDAEGFRVTYERYGSSEKKV